MSYIFTSLVGEKANAVDSPTNPLPIIPTVFFIIITLNKKIKKGFKK
jgi:hypothetical protein